MNQDHQGSTTATTTAIEHRTFELDGVRVHHFPSAEATVDVTLIFGVGVRDETLPTLGTLHALEHLVMDSVRRTPISINGSVDHSTTEFSAIGSAPLVSDFLNGVGHSLAHPPVERLAAEIKVLEAEGAEDEGGSPLATARYGWRDLGICGGPGPGPSGIRSETVQQAAARWFVAGNAVLIVDGPWPEGLRLPLPTGQVPNHDRVAPRRWERPHAVTVDGPACAVGLVLPPTTPNGLELIAVSVIKARLMEVLRHERGLTYDVSAVMAVTADRRWDLFVETDPRQERIGEAVRSLVEVIGALLCHGPSPDEVERARAEFVEASRGRAGAITSITNAAVGRLQDSGVAVLGAASAATITHAEVTAYLRDIATDVLFLVDESTEPDLREIGIPLFEGEQETPVPMPDGEVFRPPLLALALSRDARASRVVLTDSGLAHQLEDHVTWIPWESVAGVMRDDDGDLVVFGLDGSSIPVGPNFYKKGQRLVDAVLANVSGALVYDAPPNLDATGVRE